MPKLIITDDLTRDFILQVTPLVIKATNWDLELSTLNTRSLPKDQWYEGILLGQHHHIGIHGWQDVMPDFLERPVEYLIEENALAAYQPG